MASKSKVKAVLFDLDGTLADTSPDMTDALNTLLDKHGKPQLEHDFVRQHTSRGGAALIELGFGQSLKNEHAQQLRCEFLELYSEALCIKTKLFEGVPELLDALDQAKLPWGIVTNKPGRLAEPLVQQLDIAFRAVCMVSGDSLSRKKPSPDQLLHAATMLGIEKSNCIYVGDDQRDVQAGKAADMITAVAAYGYIHNDHDPSIWGGDIVINQPIELKNWLFDKD